MAFEYMSDCIHLKACRRLQLVGESNGHRFARHCTEECTAYVSGNSVSVVLADDAVSVARRQYDGRSDAYDVYCSSDFPSYTIGELIDMMQE